MRINNNITALNTLNQMNTNNNAVSRNMERLSSGLRINRAADDAAGLSISENMRGQIRGLEQASANAQDGVSLIQTAEGALNEVHAILQRQRELAVQGANDTNDTAERDAIANELTQLSDEIGRILEETTFNGINLFGESAGSLTLQVGANAGAGQTVSIDLGALNPADVGVTIGADLESLIDERIVSDALDFGAIETFVSSIYDADPEDLTEINDAIDALLTGLGIDGDLSDATTAALRDSIRELATSGIGEEELTVRVSDLLGGNEEVRAALVANETDRDSVADDVLEGILGEARMTDIASNAPAGANADEIRDLQIAAALEQTNPTTNTDFQNLVDQFDSAISAVSEQRSSFGAVQNRLEHTINNLNTSAENLTAAESRIRDTDMAQEMMIMTRNNVLQQAAQAMLAQANQQPQAVLQLLR